MSRSVNRVTLVGNLGADPELRSTQGGDRVANLSLATSEQWKDKVGQKQERTEWHRITLWKGLADVAEKYLKKGDTVYIEGQIQYRQYQDKDGVTKYMTEIRGSELVMLGGKDAGNGGGGFQKPAPAGAAKKEPTYDDFPADFPEDDDLPFS